MVNQRMLNGGKQGSGSGLDADLVDAKNAADLGIDLSSDTILSNDAANTRAAAEARHAAGLAQVNADGGFFDAYVDQSRISSISSLQILSNKLKLLTDEKQANLSSAYTSSMSSAGLGFDAKKSFSGVKLTVHPELIANSVTLYENGSSVKTKSITSGTVSISYQIQSGNTYHLLADWSEYGYLNFSDTGSDKTSSISADYFGARDLSASYSSPGSLVGFEKIELLPAQSGKATHTQFTFTDSTGTAFTPSKIGVFPEYDASGSGEDLTIDLVNSSGTTVKTFQTSDFNQLQSVSVSDDTFHIEVNPSGDGSSSPEVEYVDVRGV